MKGTVIYLGAEPAKYAALCVERFERYGGRQNEAEEAVGMLEQQCKLLAGELAAYRTAIFLCAKQIDMHILALCVVFCIGNLGMMPGAAENRKNPKSQSCRSGKSAALAFWPVRHKSYAANQVFAPLVGGNDDEEGASSPVDWLRNGRLKRR